MAVPKQRQTSSRGKRRRGGHLKPKNMSFIKCSHCAQMIEPHRVCPFCGHYKGKEVIDVIGKKMKKNKKKK